MALADEALHAGGARCHLTQPAFSALIRQLEDSAGLRLFDRDTRNVELTAEGRVLEASARRLLTWNWPWMICATTPRGAGPGDAGRVAVAGGGLAARPAGGLP